MGFVGRIRRNKPLIIILFQIIRMNDKIAGVITLIRLVGDQAVFYRGYGGREAQEAQ